jgi:hypothetical protein
MCCYCSTWERLYISILHDPQSLIPVLLIVFVIWLFLKWVFKDDPTDDVADDVEFEEEKDAEKNKA